MNENKLWNLLMNSEKNPLASLPKIVRFQLMSVLSVMWTVLFTASLGIMVWAPGLILAHVGILFIGIFTTGWLFRISGNSN